MTQPLYTLRQLAYVVDDLDASLEYWTGLLKVGPFFRYDHLPIDDQVYRGSPGDADLSIAVGNSGALQIELIHQHNDAPSVYREFIDAGRQGVHHFGMMPVDYDATRRQFVELGHEPAFECTIGGAPLVYFDAVEHVGHFIELWDNCDFYKNLFRMVEDAAVGWDGSDPVRPGPL